MIAPSTCSVKPLSNIAAIAFKLLYKSINAHNDKNRFLSSVTAFWVVQHNFPLQTHIGGSDIHGDF